MNAIIITNPDDLQKYVKESVKSSFNSLISELRELDKDRLTPEWRSRYQFAKDESISISMVDKLTYKGQIIKKKIGRKALVKWNPEYQK